MLVLEGVVIIAGVSLVFSLTALAVAIAAFVTAQVEAKRKTRVIYDHYDAPAGDTPLEVKEVPPEVLAKSNNELQGAADLDFDFDNVDL